jgi:transposase-like protein
MEHLRWGEGTVPCPHCDSAGADYIRPANGVSRRTRTGAMSERRVWRCKSCRKQFSALTGTVFHGTKVSLRKWVLVVFEMASSKNGVSAREVQRKYDVCPRTAWFMMHRIREAMARKGLVTAMQGVVVADETFIGGKERNKHAWRRSPTSTAGGLGKTPVVSLIDSRTGEVRSAVVPDVTGATLERVIRANVDMPQSVLMTDERRGYRRVGRRFAAHEVVNHSAGEYVRGGATTTGPRGYFSQLKRSLAGTYHHVSVEHLGRYLAEFDYRYTTRNAPDAERMAALVRRHAQRARRGAHGGAGAAVGRAQADLQAGQGRGCCCVTLR